MKAHEILGVNKKASANEIKEAYKKLARKYHPDRNNGKDEDFKKILAAYEELSNEKTQEEPVRLYTSIGKIMVYVDPSWFAEIDLLDLNKWQKNHDALLRDPAIIFSCEVIAYYMLHENIYGEYLNKDIHSEWTYKITCNQEYKFTAFFAWAALRRDTKLYATKSFQLLVKAFMLSAIRAIDYAGCICSNDFIQTVSAILEQNNIYHTALPLCVAVIRNNFLFINAVCDDAAKKKWYLNGISDEDGLKNPMFWAIRNDSLDVVKLFLRHRVFANGYFKNSCKQSYLQLAARLGRDEIMHELIKNGANVHYQDDIGWTCLHSALSANQFITAVKLAKEHHVSVNTRNHSNKSPLDLIDDPKIKFHFLIASGQQEERYVPPEVKIANDIISGKIKIRF